jgi:hypothetical protein
MREFRQLDNVIEFAEDALRQQPETGQRSGCGAKALGSFAIYPANTAARSSIVG